MNPVRPTRRTVVMGMLASGLAPRSHAAAEPAVTPETFGAKGDGRTNDTRAFAAMSAHLNARGGGTVVLRRVTYIVGEQQRGEGGRKPSFAPLDIIHLKGCTRPITIVGNGAILRAAPGLRYGRFDPGSGQPLPRPPPHHPDVSNAAIPYAAMLYIHRCSGSIAISDLELDGNLQNLWIGGPYGGGGYQAGAFGIRLGRNSASERLSHIHSHHHPADGIMLNPVADRSGQTTATDVICEYNGHQACSITGGRNFLFQRCRFNHTRRVVLHSSPGHGVDIEAEGIPIRNVAFEDCEFADNRGMGVGAGRTNAADIRFARCKFVGTTNISAALVRPGVRFLDCQFVGTVGHMHGDSDPAQATQFLKCTFTDDPTLSPTGSVFVGRGPSKPIAIIGDCPNLLFSDCRFRLIGEAVLPQTANDVIYSSCTMSQRAPGVSAPRGTYIGRNSITGNVNLAGSIVRGTLIVNGRPYSPATGTVSESRS
jgi:hypothetical protein